MGDEPLWSINNGGFAFCYTVYIYIYIIYIYIYIYIIYIEGRRTPMVNQSHRHCIPQHCI